MHFVHILSIKGRDIKPCIRYTAEQVKPMKDLEEQFAQVSAAQEAVL